MLETNELTFQEIKNRVREKISTKIAGIKMIIAGNLMMVPELEHAKHELADYIKDSFHFRPEYLELCCDGYIVKLRLDLDTSIDSPALKLSQFGEPVDYGGFHYVKSLALDDFSSSFMAVNIEELKRYFIQFTRGDDGSYVCEFNTVKHPNTFEKTQVVIHPSDSSADADIQAVMTLLATHEVLEELKKHGMPLSCNYQTT